MTLTALLRTGAFADEFARLRNDVAALTPSPRHVVILGAAGGEGVTTVAAHLALALTGLQQAGRVLLADGNLRRPSLERQLELPPGPGLMDWDLSAPLPTRPLPGVPGVQVLTAGSAAASAGGPSIEARLSAACVRARNDFAASVWDAPPVLDYSDGLDLAAASDGALVVIEMDRTRVGGLQYLRSAIERRHAVLLGSLLNRTGRYWPRAPRRPPL
jgi:Mrp family chromosome partitioning ATPase